MSQITSSSITIPGGIGAIPTTFRTTAGDAIPALNILTLTNGNNFTFTGAGSAVTGAVTGTTQYAIQLGNATHSLSSLALGTSGQLLQSGGAGVNPAWTTTTYPATAAIGDILVATVANTITAVTGAATAGWILTANGAGTSPTFQAAPAGVTYASDAETIAGTVTNKAVAPSNLKAKLGLQTVHALPIGNSDSLALGWLAVGANGETLMGSTGANCGWTSSPQFGGSVTALNDISSTAGSVSSLAGSLITRDVTNTATGPSLYFQKARVAATITSGDELGKQRFGGYDGTGYITGAKITSTNSGTVATNRIAGDLKFYTHPDSAIALPSEPLLRMSIASTGEVTIIPPDSGTGLTVSGGGITCTSGDITATLGDVAITAGNLTIPASSSTVGQIVQDGSVLLHTQGGETGNDIFTNLFLGKNAGNFTHSAATNFGGDIGIGGLTLANSVGGENFALGYKALYTLVGNIHAGARNVAIGRYAGMNLLGTSVVDYEACFNVLIGYAAGYSLNANEFNNIYFNNIGVAGESAVLRIGEGTGADAAACLGTRKLCKAYIGGITGITPGGAGIEMVVIDSSGQLGSQTIPGGGGGLTWSIKTADLNPMVIDNGYIANKAGLLTFTLPTTCAVGKTLRVTGMNTAVGWRIAQSANQIIHFGTSTTTTGVGGYIEATNIHDSVELVCCVADLEFIVISSTGNITIA